MGSKPSEQLIVLKTAQRAEWTVDLGAPLGTPGGFGQVFQGYGSATGDTRAVAIKRVRLSTAEGEEWGRKRRQREIDIGTLLSQQEQEGADLSHLLFPLDWVEVDDDLFIIMPAAVGSLRALRPEPSDWNTQLPVIMEITTGLMQLAEVGILHRDLKPDNILFHNDLWKLADFGISRDLSVSTDSKTFTGYGSAPYMAPELWDHQRARVPSDLYALGIVAFELLTGSPPFQAEYHDAYRELHHRVVPPIIEGIPPPARRLISSLLEKDPRDRPRTAVEVYRELERAATYEPSPSIYKLVAQADARERAAQAANQAAIQRKATQDAVENLAEIAKRSVVTAHRSAADDLRTAFPETELTQDEDALRFKLSIPQATTTTTLVANFTNVTREAPILWYGILEKGSWPKVRGNLVCLALGAGDFKWEFVWYYGKKQLKISDDDRRLLQGRLVSRGEQFVTGEVENFGLSVTDRGMPETLLRDIPGAERHVRPFDASLLIDALQVDTEPRSAAMESFKFMQQLANRRRSDPKFLESLLDEPTDVRDND